MEPELGWQGLRLLAWGKIIWTFSSEAPSENTIGHVVALGCYLPALAHCIAYKLSLLHIHNNGSLQTACKPILARTRSTTFRVDVYFMVKD